jgi:predicted acetyltransferase
MASRVRVETAGPHVREAVAKLMQLYLHDICEYEDDPVDERGLFDLGNYFDLYWTEAERHPFLIWADDQLVGFALVREIARGTFSIGEFFVRRGCRGSGIGATAASELFDRFRGTWKVAELERNVPAQRFWRRVIGEYTDGRFSEEWSEAEPKGPMQVFSNLADE